MIAGAAQADAALNAMLGKLLSKYVCTVLAAAAPVVLQRLNGWWLCAVAVLVPLHLLHPCPASVINRVSSAMDCSTTLHLSCDLYVQGSQARWLFEKSFIDAAASTLKTSVKHFIVKRYPTTQPVPVVCEAAWITGCSKIL